LALEHCLGWELTKMEHLMALSAILAIQIVRAYCLMALLYIILVIYKASRSVKGFANAPNCQLVASV